MLPTLYFTEIKPKLFNELLSAFDEIDIRLIADDQHAEGLDQPAWYLIDWLTKDRAGLEICRDLRAAKMSQSAYITMVLDPFDNDDDTKRRAIKAGADGYLTGPLTIEKMLTRLTMLSTTERSAQDCDVVKLSNLEIDMPTLKASYNGNLLKLSLFELHLLSHFAKNKNVVLSRNDIIATVGKNDLNIDEKTVDVWVGRIRKAFKNCGAPNYIRTIISKGYMFIDPSAGCCQPNCNPTRFFSQ